jgi:hypothetical protein
MKSFDVRIVALTAMAGAVLGAAVMFISASTGYAAWHASWTSSVPNWLQYTAAIVGGAAYGIRCTIERSRNVQLTAAAIGAAVFGTIAWLLISHGWKSWWLGFVTALTPGQALVFGALFFGVLFGAIGTGTMLWLNYKERRRRSPLPRS